ncbi:Auxin-responsive protein IAA1 [Capsicum chinense]|nr:Auxin-responsive protein IAA1 [Capsicum chinense]
MKSKTYNKHLLVESDTSTRQICGTKRGLFEAIDQLMSLGSTTSSNPHENEISTTVFKLETQVVGWPPVRSQRKKEVVETKKWCKYLKVAVDGVPYLRKVDLEMFTTYDQLLSALTDLFTIENRSKHRNDPVTMKKSRKVVGSSSNKKVPKWSSKKKVDDYRRPRLLKV